MKKRAYQAVMGIEGGLADLTNDSQEAGCAVESVMGHEVDDTPVEVQAPYGRRGVRRATLHFLALLRTSAIIACINGGDVAENPPEWTI